MAGEYNWTGTYTALVNAQAVANAGDNTSTAVSLDGKLAASVGVTVAYGGTATQGVRIYVVGLVDGTNYEAEADLPWGIVMPYAVSTTYRRLIPISAAEYPSFKIVATNDSGASITLDVDYDTATAAA